MQSLQATNLREIFYSINVCWWLIMNFLILLSNYSESTLDIVKLLSFDNPFQKNFWALLLNETGTYSTPAQLLVQLTDKGKEKGKKPNNLTDNVLMYTTVFINFKTTIYYSKNHYQKL